MKLTLLHEEGLEGIGFKYVMRDKVLPDKKTTDDNLGRKIAQTTNNRAFQPKKNIRAARQSNPGKPSKIDLHKKSRLATASPVPKKPRHRKFLGIDKPQTPY